MEGTKKIEVETTDITVYAEQYAIASQEDMEAGNDQLKLIKELKKEVEDTFGPIKTKAHATWKESVAQEKRHLEPLDAAVKVIKGKMGNYLDELEVERQKEEKRLAEVARKEKEKAIAKANKRMDKLMEKASDTQGQIDTLQKELADNPTLSDDEEAIISAKIGTLQAKLESHTEAAEEKAAEVEEIVVAPVVTAPVSKPAPKVKGLSSTVKKKGEVVNPMQLIKAVAEGRIPHGVITFDMVAINKLLNAGMVAIPGVTWQNDRTIRTR